MYKSLDNNAIPGNLSHRNKGPCMRVFIKVLFAMLLPKKKENERTLNNQIKKETLKTKLVYQ